MNVEVLDYSRCLIGNDHSVQVNDAFTLKTDNNNFLVVVKIGFKQHLKPEVHEYQEAYNYVFLWISSKGEVLKQTNCEEYLLLKRKIKDGINNEFFPIYQISSEALCHISAWVNSTFKFELYPISEELENEILSKAEAKMNDDIDNDNCYSSFANYVLTEVIIYYRRQNICVEIKPDQWYDEYMLGGIDCFNPIYTSYKNSGGDRFKPDFNIWEKKSIE